MIRLSPVARERCRICSHSRQLSQEIRRNPKEASMNRRRSIITQHWYPGRAAIAGIVTTLVYSIAMEQHKWITANHFSDVRFLEGLLPGDKREQRFASVAW